MFQATRHLLLFAMSCQMSSRLLCILTISFQNSLATAIIAPLPLSTSDRLYNSKLCAVLIGSWLKYQDTVCMYRSVHLTQQNMNALFLSFVSFQSHVRGSSESTTITKKTSQVLQERSVSKKSKKRKNKKRRLRKEKRRKKKKRKKSY